MRLRRREVLQVGCVDLKLVHIADSKLGALEPALLTIPAQQSVRSAVHPGAILVLVRLGVLCSL